MDIDLTVEGSITSIRLSYDVFLHLFIIAIPICLIWWRILKRKSFPEKPRKIKIAIATIITTIVVYVVLISSIFFLIKLLYIS